MRVENNLKIEGYELLSQKVYRALKTEIIKGSLKPGTKLSEGKIAEQMGVSRTPVREALKELAAEGFVKMNPNQAVVVSNASVEDVQEVLQIRGVLEGLAARLAAKLIRKEEIKELEKYIDQMEYYAKKNDSLSFSEIDAEFHEIILDICGNSRLVQIRKNLSDQAHRYRIRSLSIPGRLKYSLKEHKEILKALKRKDSEQADRLSQIHIKNVLKNILEHEVEEEDNNKDA
ncbi:MAG TPA: GntR family transcriptional regulator [Candidatus Atribacteria bacterium]|nr:GntR family transcriptional regulator [Candidatus Atribacteria bacterium]